MKTNESGRTLIEMMGVLGLMGLLTMGSINMYQNAAAKMRANDLLENVRNRALVSSKNSSKMTYGMYDQKSGGALPVTAYGFGVADNKTGVIRGTVYGYSVAKVPVGAINGGHAVDKGTCQVLLGRVYNDDDDSRPAVGSIIEIYEGAACQKVLTSCGGDEKDEEPVPVPDVICLAVKS
jgi:hypothetical protein